MHHNLHQSINRPGSYTWTACHCAPSTQHLLSSPCAVSLNQPLHVVDKFPLDPSIMLWHPIASPEKMSFNARCNLASYFPNVLNIWESFLGKSTPYTLISLRRFGEFMTSYLTYAQSSTRYSHIYRIYSDVTRHASEQSRSAALLVIVDSSSKVLPPLLDSQRNSYFRTQYHHE